ncbi:MAG: hypothetical protein HY868_12000 [Chloroflexi bacterium]|nr:hypothetical protein [Chloroflexota bacterium]
MAGVLALVGGDGTTMVITREITGGGVGVARGDGMVGGSGGVPSGSRVGLGVGENAGGVFTTDVPVMGFVGMVIGGTTGVIVPE